MLCSFRELLCWTFKVEGGDVMQLVVNLQIYKVPWILKLHNSTSCPNYCYIIIKSKDKNIKFEIILKAEMSSS